MPKQSKTGKRRIAKKTIEWIAGIISMPAAITGEGEIHRPHALFWMTADGMIIGPTLADPEKFTGTVSKSLQSVVRQPEAGFPLPPTRVRTASPELAAALRTRHPEIEVVCASTPELDHMLFFLSEENEDNGKPDEDGNSRRSHLVRDVVPDAVGSFFRAAAGLYTAGIWELVENDEPFFSVTIEKFGLVEAVMLVTGRPGRNPGLVLFSCPDDFDGYLKACEDIARNTVPRMPPRFVFSFERGANLEPDLRKEISRHEWEVAAANAYPRLAAIDEEQAERPPTMCEIMMAEAIAAALTRISADKSVFRAAWKRCELVSRSYLVNTYGGEVTVVFSAPAGLKPYSKLKLSRR